MKYCSRCLTPDTRPRVTFNEDGVCNACLHAESKRFKRDGNKLTPLTRTQKGLKDSLMWKELETLCSRFRGKTHWDVIVPCSGGKDGSYVAWKLKHELGMNPLCITFAPQLPTEIGKENLRNFIASGFDHIMISPDPEKYRELAIKGFKEQGRPKMPFVTGISTAILQMAIRLGIPFIMYGEEGEAEYGGASDAEQQITRDYLIKYYYSGEDPSKYGSWWVLPKDEDLKKLYATHWSKFEDWDPKKHALLAIEKCGLRGEDQVGTFTRHSQLDDKLQDLHAYMMFVKFGFGRATSDANIEIRAGRMTREEGLKKVKELDGQFPAKYLKEYLEYFKMTEKEFWATVNKFKRDETNS